MTFPSCSKGTIHAVTANGMPGDRERGLEAGMDDHITKSTNSAELQATRVHWLDQSAALREAAQGNHALRHPLLHAIRRVPSGPALSRTLIFPGFRCVVRHPARINTQPMRNWTSCDIFVLTLLTVLVPETRRSGHGFHRTRREEPLARLSLPVSLIPQAPAS